MRVGILAGGRGSRLAEETALRPKPLIEIGGQPVLWHIMRYYAHFGFRDFVIALGYLGEQIKKFVTDYAELQGDLTVDLGAGRATRREGARLDWRIDLIETGLQTATGGRIKRLAPYLGEDTFLMTWGDGVSTVDLRRLVEYHRSHGKLATVTAVRPPSRFGRLELDGDRVTEFSEKPQLGEGWINGAFFVLEPGVFDYIDGDETPFEKEPLERLAREGQLMAYRHEGFWQCMDNLRDKIYLEKLWAADAAPWKVWE